MIEVILKVRERVVEALFREKVDIDQIQFSFMPERGTTDAIIVLRQLQENTELKGRIFILLYQS